MNILFYCPSNFNLNSKNINTLGGIETLNLELSRNLSAKGHKIYLSTICKSIIKRKNLINIPISTLKRKKKLYSFDYIVSSNDPDIFNLFKSSKKILWLHNTLAIEKAIRKKKIISILKNKIISVFVSKYLRDNTTKLYFFKKRIIIPNFLSNTFKNNKINLKRENNFIWSVQRERGLKEVLDIWINYIFPLNKKTRLFIFGIDKKKYDISMNFYNKNNIFFYGRVKKTKLKQIYNRSLAMICLGYDETFCLNALEANACGLPIITFAKTGLKELVRNNYNGLIAKNYKSLASNMIKILNFNNNTRKKFILNSVKNSKKYNYKDIENRWLRIFNNI